MKLTVQKRLAAQVLKCSEKRVQFDSERLDEIKEAITKLDLKSLVNDKAITRKPVKGVSKARAKKRLEQRRKGRQKGYGTTKGKRTARLSKKENWMVHIRAQRVLLRELRDNEKVSKKTYMTLYRKAGGGFFRSKRHIKLYIEEHNLFEK